VVTKRQAEQAALIAKEDKKRKSQDDREENGKGGRRASSTLNEVGRGRHSRSLSADKLAAIGGTVSSSKRLSNMKVEDWQKYQQEQPDRTGGSTSKQDSRGQRSSAISPIPFPDRGRRDSTYDRRKADRSSGVLRDPPT